MDEEDLSLNFFSRSIHSVFPVNFRVMLLTLPKIALSVPKHLRPIMCILNVASAHLGLGSRFVQYDQLADLAVK